MNISPTEQSINPDAIDRVLTIHDFWDGPVLGVATLDGVPCIYESHYYNDGEPTDLFYLTPLDGDAFNLAMQDWAAWLQWMAEHKSAVGWQNQKQLDLQTLAKQSADYRRHSKRGNFQGTYQNFYSPIENFNVTWFEVGE